MPGREFGPSDFSEEPRSTEEIRAELVARIDEFKQNGEFFQGYVEMLESELALLDSQSAA